MMVMMDKEQVFSRPPKREKTTTQKNEQKLENKEEKLENKGEQKLENKGEQMRENKNGQKLEDKNGQTFGSLTEEKKAEAHFEVLHELDMFTHLTEDLGEHPWAVKKNAKGRSYDLTPLELERLKTEETAAKNAGLTWQERGPAQDMNADWPTVPNWRGQPYRKGHYGGKVRYAKRGGANKEYYDRLNKAGLLKPTRWGAVRVHKKEDMPW